MTGFLADYDIDFDDFNDTGFDIPDGTYSFEVTKGELREGTTNDPEARNIVIHFSLVNEDEGSVHAWNWWISVPKDPSRPARHEAIAMTEWKKWLIGAGFDQAELGAVGPDDVAGLTGTVNIVSSKPNKAGRVYQNPKDWAFDEEEAAPAPKPKTKAKAAPKAAPKRAPEPVEEDEEDGDEEEAAPAPARARKANPFAKK